MTDQITKTETVKTASDGSVKISLEKFQELTAKANEPKTVNVTRVMMTPAQRASADVLSGDISMLFGVMLLGVGGYLRYRGVSALKKIS
jgi:hypothetical protein